MMRSPFLVLGFLALAQVMPEGCPLPPAVDDGTPLPPRGTMEVSASASAASAQVGETVELIAEVSGGSLEAGEVSYAWAQTDGPGVPIIDADKPRASFVARSLETRRTLTFLVTTSDADGNVGRAEVSVAVEADPDFGVVGGPVARAGGNRTVLGGSLVTLDGSASSGSGLSFAWRQVFGGVAVTLNGADTARPSFTAPPFFPGGSNSYRFELTVRDDRDRTSSDSVTVTVRDPSAGDDGTGVPRSKPRVRFSTTMGDFVLELDNELAPITVNNFLEYVDDGFYVGTIFHRVIENFIVQGGGFTPDMVMKENRDPIPSEADNGLKNVRGSVAMALERDDPDSARSQFFVNLKDNDHLDHTPSNPGFTVFGRVVEGMDVIDAIGRVRTSNRGLPPNFFEDVPIEDILIQAVERVASAPTP